jgi:biotin synthase-like enzyme
LSKKYVKDKIEFCSIINARNGKCSQNCRYCAQSSHYNTEIETFQISKENIEDICIEFNWAVSSKEINGETYLIFLDENDQEIKRELLQRDYHLYIYDQ